MHFYNRNLFHTVPTARLSSLHASQQSRWLNYKAYLIAKKNFKINGKVGVAPVTVAIPTGYWTEDQIRIPLMNNFDSNCGYCGIFCDNERNGQVDHYLPKSKDTSADHIYNWENYIWSCPSCNNIKDNFYYVLDPCSQPEMDFILFNPLTGKYQFEINAATDVINRFNLTDLKTYMNGKNRPRSRKLIYKQMKTIYLENIKQYKAILSIISVGSAKYNQINDRLNTAEMDLAEFIQEPNYISLKREIFNKYKSIYLITKNFEDYK